RQIVLVVLTAERSDQARAVLGRRRRPLTQRGPVEEETAARRPGGEFRRAGLAAREEEAPDVGEEVAGALGVLRVVAAEGPLLPAGRLLEAPGPVAAGAEAERQHEGAVVVAKPEDAGFVQVESHCAVPPPPAGPFRNAERRLGARVAIRAAAAVPLHSKGPMTGPLQPVPLRGTGREGGEPETV